MTTHKRFYYAVSDLHFDDVDVIVLAGGEGEVVARRRTIWRRRESSVIWRVRIPVREPGRPTRFQYRDLPPHVVVTRWRPLAGFLGPLPAPAKIMPEVKWQSPPEPPAPAEGTDELESAGEYNAPPSISLRECEIRLLRGLRCDRARGNRTAGAGGPGGYRDSLMLLVRRTIGKLEAEHVDEAIAPAGQAWMPSRRDLGDYLTAMAWFTALTAAQRSLIFQRSLNPPFSFRVIGSRVSKSAEWARRHYQKALEAAQQIANGRAR